MKHTAEFYLLMLGYLLVEIRNLEREELSYAPKLAYIFHNVPALLNYNFNDITAEQAYEDITARAAALGLSQWLEGCEQSVRARMAYRQESRPEQP